MTQTTTTASAASLVLAALIVAATWLPTLSMPAATARSAAAPTHVILA